MRRCLHRECGQSRGDKVDVIIREHIETAHDFDIETLLWYRRYVCKYKLARVGILCSLQRDSKKRIKPCTLVRMSN